jgi:hypothetical protein
MTRLESLIAQLITYFSNLYKITTGSTGKNNIVSTTAVTTGDWVAVQVLADAVISSAIIDGAAVTALSGTTLSQGIWLYGKITSITLASGIVRCYGNINIAY